MAKLQDKFFNRVIEGDLELGENEQSQVNTLADARVEDLVEGGTLDNAKPIYWHTIRFERGGTAETSTYGRIYGEMIILTNSSEPITLTDFINLLKTPGFVGIVINGKCSLTGASDFANMDNTVQYLIYKTDIQVDVYYRNDITGVVALEPYNLVPASFSYFADLGANKIN